MRTTPCRSLFPAFSLNAILPHPVLSALAMFNLWSLKFTLPYFMVKARNIPFLREIRFAFLDLWATPTHPSEFSLKTALPPGSPSYLGMCPRHSTRPTITTGLIHTRTFVSSRSFIVDVTDVCSPCTLRALGAHPARLRKVVSAPWHSC